MTAILALLAVLGLVLAGGRQPVPFPPDSESAQRLQAGPWRVSSHDFTFLDETREPSANGGFRRLDQRRLQATLWYPAQRTAAPFPLVVYSHGFASLRKSGAYLAVHLASLGHVVVSANFPLTRLHAPGGPNARDVLNQPADVSFIIDTLLRQAVTPGHRLEGMIDPARIGAMGNSLGGLTSILVAFHPRMRDSRVTAVLAMAAPTMVFTEVFFSRRSLPLLMLAGELDAMVDYQLNAAPLPDLAPGAELVTIAGGSHIGFSGPSAPLRWLNHPDFVVCTVVRGRLESTLQEAPWHHLLGTPQQGINYQARAEPCIMDPLPPALNVLRQQMITKVVVSSFFQARFASEPAQRAAARRYLGQVLAREVAEVRYRRSELPEPAVVDDAPAVAGLPDGAALQNTPSVAAYPGGRGTQESNRQELQL